MAGRVMRGALKSQERVDGRYGRAVRGPNPDSGTARTISDLIGDLRVASRHDGRAWNYLGVHMERPGKVPCSKRRRYIAHVLSDRDDPGAVSEAICVKDDAPAVPKVLKNVGRRVLIHAHDSLSTCLHGRERRVRLARGGFAPAPAPGDGNREGGCQDSCAVLSCHRWREGRP